jgi:hypothetical protein
MHRVCKYLSLWIVMVPQPVISKMPISLLVYPCTVFFQISNPTFIICSIHLYFGMISDTQFGALLCISTTRYFLHLLQWYLLLKPAMITVDIEILIQALVKKFAHIIPWLPENMILQICSFVAVCTCATISWCAIILRVLAVCYWL